MSIYLSHNNRMILLDPNRYIGWLEDSGLMYLTYFTTDVVDNASYDTPILRNNNIPLIYGAWPGWNKETNHQHTTIGSVDSSDMTGLDSSFLGIDCQQMSFKRYGTQSFSSKSDLDWNLPFTETDAWSITYRAFYPTYQYITVQYEEPSDRDIYYLNPSVSLVGVNNLFGTSNFLSSTYKHNVLSSYKSSSERRPLVWPRDMPGTTLYNGTGYNTYKDPGYESVTPYPPAGRLFYSFGNNQIPEHDGDQWYYVVIVGHGDGTISIYVNGHRMINMPFEKISKIRISDDADTLSSSSKVNYAYTSLMSITELSLWNRDLSINDRMNVPLKTQPIYKKVNGAYVPNELY